jgi:hypothetical protein
MMAESEMATKKILDGYEKNCCTENTILVEQLINFNVFEFDLIKNFIHI